MKGFLKDEKKIWPLSKYSAEISMGEYDYERFHKLLSYADMLRIMVLNRKIEAIRPFFAVLDTFYANISFFSFDKRLELLRNSLKEKLEEWEALMSDNKKLLFPIQLAEDLLRFHELLMTLKQYIGLGIRVSRKENLKEKLRKAADLI